MKRYCFAIFASIAAILTQTQAGAEPRPVRLGGVLPLSGDLAYYGSEIRNGLLLAQEDSAHPVELAIEDAPLLGHRILTAFEKLLRVDRIDCLAANFSNQGMLLMADSIKRHQLPAFHSAAADQQILDASEWIFTTNVRVADEASAAAEYVFNVLKARRAAVLAVQTSFGLGYRKAFIQRFEALGGQVVADEQQDISDVDVRTQTLRVRAAKPEVVFLATFGPFLGNAVKQMKQLGVTAPLFTVYEAEDPSVVATAGTSALEGIRYFVSYSQGSTFEQRYRERFGTEPQTFSRTAYDAAQLLIEATVPCNFDRMCVKERLYEIRGYRGVSGTFDIEADGGAKKVFHLHEYRHGRFQAAE
jgi:branched-chain amino acid transport system substrate-binding protein